MRLFFATDLHGSEVCFRKFCAAPGFYNCDVLVLGGDLTGKLLVPIVKNGRSASYELGDLTHKVRLSEVDVECRRLENMGYYPVVGDQALVDELSDPDAYERLLIQHAIERCRQWVAYADERLSASGVRIVIAPGNDDPLEIDAAFEGSAVFVNADQRVVEFEGLEIASLGWSNPTPWHTPRECSEEELADRIERVVGRLRDPGSAVFNFHVPPFDTRLDVCSQLDEDLRVVTMLGNPIPMHAGSTAVRAAIDRYQPRMSLHGHIHESRNFQRLGQTLALNPGSEYSEGVLQGAIVSFDNGNISHTFTSG